MGYYNHNTIYNKYSMLYNHWVPVFATASAAIGFVCGTCTATHYATKDIFTIIMGYSSLGLITGITFPISFPLLSGYVLYKHHK
jgi:hypothetical protein